MYSQLGQKGGETTMAKKKTDPDADAAKQILDQMVQERGERVHKGEHWDAARNALGQARWQCEKRDIFPEIAEMRRELALAGKTLADIGTNEEEITELLNSNKGTRNPAKAAQTYVKTVVKALKEGRLPSARMALTQLERNLDEAGLDFAAVGVTKKKYDAWCARLRPSKKEDKKRPKS
jgi:hypothetical protein